MDLERLLLSIKVFVIIEVIIILFINSKIIIKTCISIANFLVDSIVSIIISIVKYIIDLVKYVKTIIEIYSFKIKCRLFRKMMKEDDGTHDVNVTICEPPPVIDWAGQFEVHHCAYQDLTKIVTETWNNLPKGYILYNPPSEMRMGIKERIEVRITNKITKDLQIGLKGKGKPILEDIKVSLQMKARLDGGDAFEIKKLFDSETMTIIGDYTQWDWDVTPLKSGIQKLLLYVSGIIEIKDLSDRFFCVPVFEREIHVGVNYNYKIKKLCEKYWQWIIGTISALLGLIITYYAS